jgi:hypothetical protein
MCGNFRRTILRAHYRPYGAMLFLWGRRGEGLGFGPIPTKPNHAAAKSVAVITTFTFYAFTTWFFTLIARTHAPVLAVQA